MRRVLILARRRLRPRDRPDTADEERLTQDAWRERYRDAIEGFDDSFDNGAGAFAAIVDAENDTALTRLLAEYPLAAWVDVEVRPQPPLTATERRRLLALAERRRAAIVYCRTLPFAEAHHEMRRRDLALLAEAEPLVGAHPLVAGPIASLRHYYQDFGPITEMERTARRLLAVHEALVGPDDPALFIDWIVLAGALGRHGGGPWSRRDAARAAKAGEAEAAYRRALALAEHTRPADHPDVRAGVHQLAQFYRNQHRYRRAEPLMRRLLALDERTAESGDSLAVQSTLLLTLGDVARMQADRRRYAEAEATIHRMLALHDARLAHAEHGLQRSMHERRLADVLSRQGRYEEAAFAAARAVASLDASIARYSSRDHDPRHAAGTARFLASLQAQRAWSLQDQAGALRKLGDAAGAERLYRTALETLERGAVERAAIEETGAARTTDADQWQYHSTLVPILREYASLLRALGRRQEAGALARRARSLRAALEAHRRAMLAPQAATTEGTGPDLPDERPESPTAD